MNQLTEAAFIRKMASGEPIEENRGVELMKRVQRDALQAMTKASKALDKMRGLANGMVTTQDTKRFSSDLLNVQDHLGTAEAALGKLQPIKDVK